MLKEFSNWHEAKKVLGPKLDTLGLGKKEKAKVVNEGCYMIPIEGGGFQIVFPRDATEEQKRLAQYYFLGLKGTSKQHNNILQQSQGRARNLDSGRG